MELQPSELIDRMSIVKLKIERIGEPHLKGEFEEYKKAISDLKRQGIIIKDEWFNELYEINGKIWDLDFKVRNLVDKKIENISDEEFEKIGRNAIVIGEYMKERDSVKNVITAETNKGFKEIKSDHIAVSS
jgi:hypothetical protein